MKIVLIVCSLLWLAFMPVQVLAASIGPSLRENAALYSRADKEFASAIVIDVQSGKVLYEYQADKPWPAASLTKLVGALVFLDHHPAWNKIVTLTKRDEVGGGRLRVADGARLTVLDLLYSSITASANNAAMAMARLSGLGYSGFLRAMNQKIKALGLLHTHFVDASGIDPKNITTAHELAKIAMTAFDQDRIHRAATTQKYRFVIRNTGAVKEIKNTNALLASKEYERLFVTGGKTGFINESGYNLAVRLRPRDAAGTDRMLMVVVFGSPTREASFRSASSLANWAWQVYH